MADYGHDLVFGTFITPQNAGRDPREIRRLLNISPEIAAVERMVPLALEDGVSAQAGDRGHPRPELPIPPATDELVAAHHDRRSHDRP